MGPRLTKEVAHWRQEMSQDYCPLCRLSVAPFDPERRTREGKQVVHLSCIIRHEGRDILANCDQVLKETVGELSAKVFALEAAKANNPKKLASLLSNTLSIIYRRTKDSTVRQRVCALAKTMGARLTFEVTIRRTKPKSSFNTFH